MIERGPSTLRLAGAPIGAQLESSSLSDGALPLSAIGRYSPSYTEAVVDD